MIRPAYFIVMISMVFCSCRTQVSRVTEEQIPHVRIASVSSKKMTVPVHTAGVLSSSEDIKLSFKTGGIIRKINVSEGDRVKKGQSLATLDLSEISASVNQAMNALEKARRDYSRADNLYRDSVATLEMKQNAATALDVAESVYEAVRFNLKYSSIVAPDNGIIQKQLARQNELVSSGYPVFLFGTSGKYWKIKAGLSDRDMVKIHPGDSAVVTFDAHPGITFPAVTDQISAMADPYTGTFETEILVQDRGLKLAAGFVAGVFIYPSSGTEYKTVPVGSIVEADGHEGYVYMLSDSSKVKKVKVRIEGMPGEAAAVRGIPDGFTSVIIEGAAYLKDGMKVEVVK